MKKAVFPVYILLVIGFFACLQTDESITGKLLTNYSAAVMIKQACLTQNANQTSVIQVKPSGAKIYSSYKINGAIQLAMMQRGQYCGAAAYLNRQDDKADY